MQYDVIIRGGTVVDGSGKAPYRADLALKDGRIAAIGSLESQDAVDEIDAAGLHVLPGFIDTHVHSDMALLHDRQHANGLAQGITTEILGQDGISYAPLSPENRRQYALYNRGLNGCFDDVALDFSNVEQYLSCFDGRAGINAAYNVPHGAVRLEGLGLPRPAAEGLCPGQGQGPDAREL